MRGSKVWREGGGVRDSYVIEYFFWVPTAPVDWEYLPKKFEYPHQKIPIEWMWVLGWLNSQKFQYCTVTIKLFVTL